MAIIKSAKKRIKSSARKKVFNLRRSRKVKETQKDFLSKIKEGDKKKAGKILPELYKAIDKAQKRGVLKKNTAARKKSQLAKKLN